MDVTWITPDGREIRIGSVQAESSMSYRISQDKNLVRRLDGRLPHEALFADPENPERCRPGDLHHGDQRDGV